MLSPSLLPVEEHSYREREPSRRKWARQPTGLFCSKTFDLERQKCVRSGIAGPKLSRRVLVGFWNRAANASSHGRTISIPKDVGKAEYRNGQKNDSGCERPV